MQLIMDVNRNLIFKAVFTRCIGYPGEEGVVAVIITSDNADFRAMIHQRYQYISKANFTSSPFRINRIERTGPIVDEDNVADPGRNDPYFVARL
ncbi:hypothetical protein PATSB16_39870 [Pandoraea thiooxydans]|nr:hypothetical protein PATSB16_39870 [Pandoraea thiooxydans]